MPEATQQIVASFLPDWCFPTELTKEFMDSQGFALGVVVVVNNPTQVSAFMFSSYLKIQTPRVYSETAHRKKFQVAGWEVCGGGIMGATSVVTKTRLCSTTLQLWGPPRQHQFLCP